MIRNFSLDELVESLIDAGYRKTCLPRRVLHDGISFIKSYQDFESLYSVRKRLFVFLPQGLPVHVLPQQVEWLVCENPGLEFALVHNSLPRGERRPDVMVANASIHESAVIGAEGLWYASMPNGYRIRLESHGNLSFGHGVAVGALSVVHRGVIHETSLLKGVKIGAHCSVGHDVIIGEDTVVTAGVKIAGCCEIGSNCYFGIGSVVISDVQVCDNVLIGAGAVVVNDIVEPGKYVGVPARRIGDWSN